MILTAETPDTNIVQYEWKINDVYHSDITQTIEADIKSSDVVSVRGLNDCGNWSALFTLDQDADIGNIILYVAVFIMAFMMFKGG